MDGVIQVPVGYCSLPIKLSPGPVTVTEVQRPGYSVASIAAVGPADDNRLLSSDPGAGTATVQIVAGGAANQTMLTFTNKVIPKGYLEVCKAKHRRNDKLSRVRQLHRQPAPAARPRRCRSGWARAACRSS